MAENSDYRKLSSFRSFISSIKVFVTDDHCLFAVGGGYSEEYSRFFFEDIHSLKLDVSRFFAAWITVAAVFIFFFFWLGVYNDVNFFHYLSGGLTLCLLWYIWNGPGTHLTVTTLTATKKIYFGRRRKALKAYRKLCEHINVAQGMVDKQELVNRLRASEKGFNI